MKATLFALAAIIAVGGIAFAHGYSDNPTGEGNVLQAMLNHFRTMQDQPDAQVSDMLAFHQKMHGDNKNTGDMIQMHKRMHGDDSDFESCAMMHSRS